MALRLIALPPLVGVRFQVLFHSPNRGAFHFSVALLSAIGRQGILSLGGWSPLIHASFHETRVTRGILEERSTCRLRGYHPLWPNFPEGSATRLFSHSSGAPETPRGPLNPLRTTALALHAEGLGSCAFARRYSRSRCSLSFPEGT